VDIGLSSAEFWRLTPGEFVALRARADAPNRQAWQRNAWLMQRLSMIAMPHERWTIAQFDPYAEPEPERAPDVNGMVALAKAITRKMGGTVKR
jgi:hypothetical protein